MKKKIKEHLVIDSEFLKTVSREPGVYLMLSRQDKVLYVGKARNIRKRLASYSRWTGAEHSKTTVMLSQVVRVETIITRTEKEAFILEASLIKKHRPRYNVILRDDKNYPYIKVTVSEQWPRLLMTRRKSNDGSKYFGPYTSSSAMWSTIKLLNTLFLLRRCKGNDLPNRKRPCLNHQMGRCMAPCGGRVDPDVYKEMVSDVILVLEGRDHQLVSKLESKMAKAAEEFRYEDAAVIRDQIASLAATLEKQIVVGSRKQDQDIYGFERSGASVAVSIVSVRHGIVSAHRSFYVSEPVGQDPEILSEVIKRFYGDTPFVPAEIILPFSADEQSSLDEWLSELRGKAVRFRVPLRGDMMNLIHMAAVNARQVFEDREKQEKSWQVLADGLVDILHLRKSPDCIECLDISNIGGQHAVGSLVCFEKGRKEKRKYRHYSIKTVEGPDDYSMMAEVLERRFRRGVKDDDLPDVLMVDGGRGQLNIARRIAKECLPDDSLELLGIAKEKEEEGEKLYRPGRKNPVSLPRNSPYLLYLMKIRDESHRYGITLHRKLRNKKTLASELDSIPGVGPKRKKELLRSLGSLKRIKAASVDDLASVAGVGIVQAKEIHGYFHNE
ncbi:MAG: excinuclease ABC subunit UvrC [Desulfobulbaceae bacterium]|uniref:UvrABC system protein C n=1 Tax=Candidatus Desulfobia pelagia TaxID=2841692 RepID=A0A8J6NDL6_9BACT|nr:excinuclease ABC subunit UvrC [Candidatus Desulfobia pelagia]